MAVLGDYLLFPNSGKLCYIGIADDPLTLALFGIACGGGGVVEE